jgi:hypothetical protein
MFYFIFAEKGARIQKTQTKRLRFFVLSNEVRADRSFFFGKLNAAFLACFDAFDEPSHIFSQAPHDLESFFVFLYLLGCLPVNHIPVLPRNDGHGGNGEVFVQYVKGCAGASSSAREDCAGRLSRKLFGIGVKKTVHKGGDRSAWGGIVYGRTEYQAVCGCDDGRKFV